MKKRLERTQTSFRQLVGHRIPVELARFVLSRDSLRPVLLIFVLGPGLVRFFPREYGVAQKKTHGDNADREDVAVPQVDDRVLGE